MKLFIETKDNRYDLDSDLPPEAFKETGKYLFVMTGNGTAKSDAYRLSVSGVPLEPCYIREGEQMEIRWVWEPEFFSGQFSPRLFYHNNIIWPEKPKGITVDADLAKVSQQQFFQMVEEIGEIAYSLSPAFKKVMQGKGHANYSLAQMELILHYISGILSSVAQISRNPKKKLISLRQDVPLAQVRQSDEKTLIKLVTGSTPLVQCDAEKVPIALKDIAARLNDHLFEKASEVRHRISYDTYENAFVKGFLLQLLNLTFKLNHQLNTLINSSRQDQITQDVARCHLARLHELRKGLNDALQLAFFQEVTPISRVDHTTVTMNKHPDYRKLYRYYLKFRTKMAPLGAEWLDVSLERTYQIYEYWCFMSLVKYLYQKYGSGDLDTSELFTVSPEYGGLSLRLKHGQSSRVRINDRMVLFYQRQYDYYHESATGSYSFQMIPDIVIEWEKSSGDVSTIIFDPKYRVNYQAIHESINKMHTYKDAIVDHNGNRIVKAAYIMIPNNTCQEGNIQLFLSDKYRVRHGLGICVVTPGDKAGMEILGMLLGIVC